MQVIAAGKRLLDSGHRLWRSEVLHVARCALFTDAQKLPPIAPCQLPRITQPLQPWFRHSVQSYLKTFERGRIRVGGSGNKIDILSGERLCLRAAADSFGIIAAATEIVYRYAPRGSPDHQWSDC